MKNLGYLFILLCCILVSCKTKRKENIEQPVVLSEKEVVKQYYPELDVRSLSDSIRAFSFKNAQVKDFYKRNQYRPVWVKKSINGEGLDVMLSYLKSASEHGFNPAWFHVKEMQELSDSVRTGVYTDRMPEFYRSMARLDYLSVEAMINYVTWLEYGMTVPGEILPKAYFIAIQKPDTAFYNSLYKAIGSSPDSLMKASQPDNSPYKNIQAGLRFYESKLDSNFSPIQVKGQKKNYKLNDKDAIFPLIAKRLMLTGELPYTEHADSIYARLTPELLGGINLFRKNNSYPEEPEVGRITVDALNRPMSYYYKKMLVNLERYRWKRKRSVTDKFIEVNVAAFNLKAVEPNQDTIMMKVCVGSVKNATPLLESSITYINLNPSWNVPHSIAKTEIYASIKKDSAYLQKKGMKLLQNGKEVDPSSVNWEEVNSNNFPYQVRQDPGGGNALGRMKFMFDNPFNVYLHDTPVRKPFLAKNRAVSHGCVRLERPMDLAYFCIQNMDSLHFDRIRYTIGQSPLSREGKDLLKKNRLTKVREIVTLNETIPLFIDYFTAYMVPDDNALYCADDVYDFDDKILKELEKKWDKLSQTL